jgi:hypothetical protein
MRGTGMEMEVEIFCYKHNQQNQVQEHRCKEMKKFVLQMMDESMTMKQ